MPDIPQPTEIEIELTNYCNAECIACPRDHITVEQGLMTEKTFGNILLKYKHYLEESIINKILGRMQYPVITFAGLGEPLLHPRISEFILAAKEEGFITILFTNASLLDSECTHRLLKSRIDQLYISFWGIEKHEYEKAMKLDYERALSNVEYFAANAPSNVSVIITWINNPELKSTISEISEFWRKKGIIVDNTDVQPWNRAGYLTNPIFNSVFDKYPSVDYNKKIWCSQLFFTDTICWNGDLILCSQDYFEKKHILGNINTNSPDQIANKKHEILKKKMRLQLCHCCKKPNRNYSFGSHPWDKILDADERSKYWYK